MIRIREWWELVVNRLFGLGLLTAAIAQEAAGTRASTQRVQTAQSV